MIPYLSRREVPVYLEKRGLEAGIAQEPLQQSILLGGLKVLVVVRMPPLLALVHAFPCLVSCDWKSSS